MPRRLTRSLVAAIAFAVAACPARAAAISGGAGIDYQAGPQAQSYRGALLFASAEATPGDLTLAAIRYKDSLQGTGVGGFANAGVNVAPSLRLRVLGLRTIGDHGFDAWRLRAGPEVSLASDVTLGGYYLRLHDDVPEDFNAGGIELTLPVLPAFSGQVGSSYGRWSGGETTLQGTVAGMFRAGARVQLLGEVSVGRNVITTSTTAPSGGGIWGGLPIAGGLGSGGTTTTSQTDRSITSVAQIGVRFLIP